MNKKLYYLSLFIAITDLIVKALVKHLFKLNTMYQIIPNFFSIYYLKNTGAAFSLLQDNTLFLIILSIVILIILHNYIRKEKDLLNDIKIPLGIVIGGIYGNLIDRIINHSVTDYLSFNILGYNFPVFNIADVAITLGALVLIINIMKESRKKHEWI